MRAIPHIQLAHLPTPIESLPKLTSKLNGPKLFVKRDDLTGLAFGGNKTRKLEYLLAEAQAHGARTVITAGAVQSNHSRQTAAACARLNFECILVLSGDKPLQATGNLMLDQLFNARLVWTSRQERNSTLQQTFNDAWEAGRRPYLVPYGGSNSTGACAYAFAMKELGDQGFKPDWIVFASSSGGTQAGLVCGARLVNFKGKVLGISVDETEADLQAKVAPLANDTSDLLCEKTDFAPQEILVSAEYLGGGYGVMGAAEEEAIRMFAREEGLLLDPVYTARAAAGMIDLIHKGYFKREEKVLFWHTGGTPALFSENFAGLADPV
ncbi:MAG: D-cysteine desulfhydrase family protein [Anaerolineae bacterium]|nr:D-cysteine desulfhydrase family protein [Anaerolineae bacterium]